MITCRKLGHNINIIFFGGDFMKKIISGLIMGMLITLSINVFAAGELLINPNPFPIHVDGQEQNLEAYNINGSTYIKLSDIPKATNNVLEVKFDQENKRININTQKDTEANISLQNTEGEEKVSEIVEQTPDGLPVQYFDGEPYVNIMREFHNKYGYGSRNGKNFYSVEEKWTSDGSSGNYILKFIERPGGEFEKLLENMPLEIKGEATTPGYISLDYYINEILPLIQ